MNTATIQRTDGHCTMVGMSSQTSSPSTPTAEPAQRHAFATPTEASQRTFRAAGPLRRPSADALSAASGGPRSALAPPSIEVCRRGHLLSSLDGAEGLLTSAIRLWCRNLLSTPSNRTHCGHLLRDAGLREQTANWLRRRLRGGRWQRLRRSDWWRFSHPTRRRTRCARRRASWRFTAAHPGCRRGRSGMLIRR